MQPIAARAAWACKTLSGQGSWESSNIRQTLGTRRAAQRSVNPHHTPWGTSTSDTHGSRKARGQCLLEASVEAWPGNCGSQDHVNPLGNLAADARVIIGGAGRRRSCVKGVVRLT